MKPLIIFILALSFWIVTLHPAYGLTATSSALPSSPSGELVQQNIEDRIKKVVEEKATASGEILAEKAHPKKAWVGTITSIANQTLTIKTRTGTRQASFTTDTVFVSSPGNKTIKSSDLGLNTQVIAMGFVDANDVLSAKRIISLTQAPTSINYQVYWGAVTTIDKNKTSLTFTPVGKDTEVKLSLTKKTKLTQGQAQKDTDVKNLTPDAQAIVIASVDDNQNLTLLRLHLL